MNFCELARASIESWLNQRTKLEPRQLAGHRAGCFVTLHSAEGDLRGCIGTINPVQDDVALEVVDNAISAATRDPRFSPVTFDELETLSLDVSILQPPQPVNDPSQLDASKYGVVVSRGGRRGVLLPDIPGVETPDYQIQIALKKAHISPTEDYQLERFEVIKHVETR